ncbi:Aspartate/glutamate/uridylate kinase [Artemisia annua]|uniref:UMP kinase n=1 Tax=Artemisia annua TaxID=35608 RepID=A0A2U1MVD8_ARTAN|nr:Aspartate/glutamate/uridylate kinase [Artemisia annua]
MESVVGGDFVSVKGVSCDEKFGGGRVMRYTTATSNPSGPITNMDQKPVTNTRWRRVVFKISGDALAGTDSGNIDPKVAMLIAREVSMACHNGVEVAIIVGGRNLFYGDTWEEATNLDRSTSYQIGGKLLVCGYRLHILSMDKASSIGLMVATVMNSILLKSTFEKLGVQARVLSAFCMPEVSEPYNRQRAIRYLEKGRVVIFGGTGAGSGNPLFSTDTVAALRASELHADAVIKGTNLLDIDEGDSIGSVTYEHISFREFASKSASVFDMTAAAFCEENEIPVVIFDLHEPGNISRALCGERIGTLIDQRGDWSNLM